MHEILQQAPPWLLRPLSATAEQDEPLLAEVQRLAANLPQSAGRLSDLLSKHRTAPSYDPAVNLANALLWERVDDFFQLTDRELFRQFCQYCECHLTPPARSRCIRRMLVHPYFRAYGLRLLKGTEHWEVAVGTPPNEYGWTYEWTWSSVGWTVSPRRAAARGGGTERQRSLGLPELTDVGQVRGLLKIRSARQLGFFLSATAEENGPYTDFEIHKRDGAARRISAPCPALLWVQRRILRKILDPIAVHPAAHGFVAGRSTVTNAQPHVGADWIIKFDLREFFPTISQHRVAGLFASFGYHLGDARFRADDRAREVAAVLARLCCITHERRLPGVLPQGAATSPAISNLICRRLDQRLAGLAAKFGDGAYTRYADDLTFSFRRSINIARFRWWVDALCHKEGFTVNQEKFRVIRRSQRQQVTGIVANDRLAVPRSERRRFRAILHNCREHGVESQARGNPAFRDYLRGFAAYVQMVDPDAGKALIEEVEQLLGGEPAP